MKKLLLLILPAVLLSCNVTYYSPVLNFSKPNTGTFYENEDFRFDLGETISCSKIKYKLTNKGKQDIEVDWNRANFIISSEAFRIYEGEMKGMDSNKEQLFQIIPGDSFKQGILVSGKNLKFSGFGGVWMADCFFKEEGKALKGKTLKLRMPIKVANEFKTYEFELVISDVLKKKSNMLIE